MLKHLKSFGKIVLGYGSYVVGIIGMNICTSMAGVIGCFGISMAGLVYGTSGWLDFVMNYCNDLRLEQQAMAV